MLLGASALMTLAATNCGRQPVSPSRATSEPARDALQMQSGAAVDPAVPALPESPAPGLRASDTPVGEAPGQTATRPEKSDESEEAIVAGVRRELDVVDGLAQHRVQVFANNGEVKLVGTVETDRARAAAVKRAGHVEGVRAVKAELDVVPAGASDSEITANIRDGLERAGFAPGAIRVSAKLRSVKLTGSVESITDRDTARAVAESVEGVRSVDNYVVLTRVEPAVDHAIAADVVHRLTDDRRLRGAQLAVRVSGGTVFLSGEVKSQFERRLAREVAFTSSVHAVYDDELEVVRGREHLRAPAPPAPAASTPATSSTDAHSSRAL